MPIGSSRAKPIIIEKLANGCHICTSHRGQKGYTKFHRNGRPYLLHRFIYEEINGSLPDGLVVRHKCDNPSCVNIEHLESGTRKDNNKDRDERGRAAVGEDSGRAKLTNVEVQEIRNYKGTGVSGTKVARQYKVGHFTVYNIWNGNGWKHLPWPCP